MQLLVAWLLGCGGAPTESAQVPTVDVPDVCADNGWTRRDRLTEGDFGPLRRQLADDFTIPTTTGDWSFSEAFSGCDSYLFVPDSLIVSPLDDTPLLNKKPDLKTLIKDGPQNVHYFFLTASESGANGFANDMDERISGALSNLSADKQAWWADRLHSVTKGVPRLNGWVGEAMTAGGASAPTGFAIDRFQRIRQFGGLADVQRYNGDLASAGYWPWDANLAYLAYEAQYYNYESDREDWLASVDWTPVYLFHDEPTWETGNNLLDVQLPDAATMAGFDTLYVDLQHTCDPTLMEYGNCDAWDAVERLDLCDPDDPDSCEEQLARYITTYHREGRWLADASQLLPLLQAGGTHRFELQGTRGGHYNTLRMLFGKTREDGLVPYRVDPLWQGGSWTETYDEEHPPITIDVPADAKQVILGVTVTGHGGESDDNCSEFCNHRHTFTVGGVEFVAEHDDIGDIEGCLKQIDQGTVPNQNGTWWYMRTSWCPGKQVDPWIFDITDQVTPGQPAEITYTTNWGDGVDGGNISLFSRVTYWH